MALFGDISMCLTRDLDKPISEVDRDIKMRLKPWIGSMIVTLLLAGALPLSAAEITSPAEQAYVTDFASGKVLFSKNADDQ